MPASNLLNSLYEKVVGAVDDAEADLASLADEIVEHFDDAVTAFTDQAHELLAVDAGGVEAVNETLAELVRAVLDAGVDVEARLVELFQTWTGLVGDLPSASADLLRTIFALVSSSPGHILAVFGAFATALSDFPSLFHALVVRGASEADQYRAYVESLLLPLLAGALSIPGGGVDLATKGIEAVMRDDRPSLIGQVTALEMGLPEAGLPNWALMQLERPGLRLRRSTWMLALLLHNLRVGAGLSAMPGGDVIPNGALSGIFQPVSDWMSDVLNSYLDALQTLVLELIARLLEDAENEFEIEWAILELARFTPVGLLFLVVAIPWKLLTSPLPFLNLLFNPIEDDPSLNVLRLEGPSASRKYIVLSDIHRDPESDAMGEFLPGSIDHFLETRQLYLDLITDLDRRGYTIIEAGDCEELWFHRDFNVQPAERLADIIASHRDLYDLLRRLHAEGRYFRVRGNHDSYLADPAVFEVLRGHMDPDGTQPFTVFDFVIIEGVKTMQDVFFHLGLDSEPNSERNPLIITHGHQWDFWNCDANNILGKLIVSAVVTPLDMLDDPFKDVGGIASQGSPAVNFKSILAELFVFDSWLSFEPAVKLLDAIQHMPDQDRRFSDSIMYSETLTSLMGLLIPVRPGPEDECGAPFVGGTCLCNLLAIGHTHNPHNQPYYDLEDIPKIGSLIRGAEQALEALTGLPTDGLSLVKSSYLNMGVCGWYERCASGIDLGDESHGTGQPKLVYWTHNTRPDRPHHMDWELPHRPQGGRIAPGDVLDGTLRDWMAFLQQAAGQPAETLARPLADSAERLVASIPIADALTAAAREWKPADIGITDDAPFQTHADRAMAQLVIGLVSAAAHGTGSQFTISVPLSQSMTADLDQVTKQQASAAALSDADPLIEAIGLLAITRELGRRGLTRPSLMGAAGADADTERLALLFTLASMSSAEGPVEVSMSRSKGAIKVKVRVGVPERAGKVSLKPGNRDAHGNAGTANAKVMAGWPLGVGRKPRKE